MEFLKAQPDLIYRVRQDAIVFTFSQQLTNVHSDIIAIDSAMSKYLIPIVVIIALDNYGHPFPLLVALFNSTSIDYEWLLAEYKEIRY